MFIYSSGSKSEGQAPRKSTELLQAVEDQQYFFNSNIIFDFFQYLSEGEKIHVFIRNESVGIAVSQIKFSADIKPGL